MKANIKLLTFSASLIALPFLFSPTVAQSDPLEPSADNIEADLPKHIRIQVEYIEMTHQQMTALLADPKVSKNDTLLRQQVTKLIEQNKAKIVETQMMICRSGEKATIESIREFIYPTEYDPPEFVCGSDKNKLKNRDTSALPLPTAFETRNLGSTLIVEPVIGVNDKYIDLTLSPEIVYHIGNIDWSTHKNEHGESNVTMPLIYTLRINTSLTLDDNTPCLAGCYTPKDEKGFPAPERKLLIFVKGTIIPVGR